MCAANFAVCACTLFTGKQEYIKVKICIIWSNMKIMMSLQLSDWRSVNYLKWHFIESDTKKNTTSSEVYTTYRWIEWIHKSCKDGQVITFTCCQNIIGLTGDKSATTGLPKWVFSGPPKYAPCVGCRISWGITLYKFPGKNCLNKHV